MPLFFFPGKKNNFISSFENKITFRRYTTCVFRVNQKGPKKQKRDECSVPVKTYAHNTSVEIEKNSNHNTEVHPHSF